MPDELKPCPFCGSSSILHLSNAVVRAILTHKHRTIAVDELLKLAERLEKRAAQERDYAHNSQVVFDLLKPEFDRFEERTGHNIYAVRMAVDHKNSAKRDAAFADDLEQAAAALRSRSMKEGE
jgi:hypothetical protein